MRKLSNLALLALLALPVSAHCDPIPDPVCGCGTGWQQATLDDPQPGVQPFFVWYGLRTSYSTNAGQIGQTIVWGEGPDCCLYCAGGEYLDLGDTIWTVYSANPRPVDGYCIPADTWAAIDLDPDAIIAWRIRTPVYAKPCTGSAAPQIAREILYVPDDPALVGVTVYRQAFLDRDSNGQMDRAGEGDALTFFDARGTDAAPLPGSPHTDPWWQAELDAMAAEADAGRAR